MEKKRTLKIAVYQPWIYQKGGMEKVILEITKKTKNLEFTIFTNYFDAESTFPDFKKRKIIVMDKVSVTRNYFELANAAIKIAKNKIDLDDFDLLVVSTAGFGEFITIRNHEIPIICYCHTPLRVIHDKKIREKTLNEMRSKRLLFLAFEKVYKNFEFISWKYFNQVVANSLETKKRIINGKIYPPENICVVHPGADLDKIKPSIKNEKYFLVAGRISELKGIELAIEAFRKLKNEEYKLIIAGGISQKDWPYYNRLKEISENQKIEFIISPTNETLEKLYRNCTAVLFTAKNEDWGIVPIEAMAHGKIVIAVDEGGPKESIIDGKTGYLLKREPEEFSRIMKRIIDNPKITNEMYRDCINNAKKYDNNNFRKQILKIIENTILKEKVSK